MVERLTIEQMAEKYPDQWLVLQNVKYRDDNSAVMESGEVIRTNMNETEAIMLQIKNYNSKGWVAWSTTKPTGICLGMVGAF